MIPIILESERVCVGAGRASPELVEAARDCFLFAGCVPLLQRHCMPEVPLVQVRQFVARMAVVLPAAAGDFQRSHQRGEPPGGLPVPALLDAVQQAGAVGIAAAGGVDHSFGLGGGNGYLPAAGIPCIFDPGQGLPLFDGETLLRLIDRADYLTVNDYECKLVEARTGLSTAALSQRLRALVITRGEHGSVIHTDGREILIPAARPQAVTDPTGCGDAYRAGLLFGLDKGMDWETSGRIASLMGAYKIETAGTQNHRFTWAEFSARFRENFGHSPD